MDEYEQVKTNQKLLKDAVYKWNEALPVSIKRCWLYCLFGLHKFVYTGKRLNGYLDSYFEYRCDCGKTKDLCEHEHLKLINPRNKKLQKSVQSGSRERNPNFYN